MILLMGVRKRRGRLFIECIISLLKEKAKQKRLLKGELTFDWSVGNIS